MSECVFGQSQHPNALPSPPSNDRIVFMESWSCECVDKHTHTHMLCKLYDPIRVLGLHNIRATSLLVYACVCAVSTCRRCKCRQNQKTRNNISYMAHNLSTIAVCIILRTQNPPSPSTRQMASIIRRCAHVANRCVHIRTQSAFVLVSGVDA